MPTASAVAPAYADLRQDRKLLANRALLSAWRKTFSWLPIVRDFAAERLFGLALKPAAGRAAVPTQWGYSMLIDPQQGGIVERSIYQSGSYETGVLDLIRRTVKPGDSVVDAGANVGVITTFAAQTVGAQGTVYAFEPVATTAELLRQTLELNNFSQVQLHEVGLSSQNGQAPIFASTATNRGGLSLEAEGHAQSVQQVELRRLDDMLTPDQWRRVSLMKIDVEGWELEVLQGAQKLLQGGHIPAMIIEYTAGSVKAHQLYELLRSLPGTALYKLRYTKRCAGGLVRVTSEEQLPQADNIFLLPTTQAKA